MLARFLAEHSSKVAKAIKSLRKLMAQGFRTIPRGVLDKFVFAAIPFPVHGINAREKA
jgi:hypothetical protein